MKLLNTLRLLVEEFTIITMNGPKYISVIITINDISGIGLRVHI